LLIQDSMSEAKDDDVIRETTDARFVQDVLEASRELPILVDFWAPWCGPCRQLTPILEAAVKRAGGRVRLVKVNIDENPAVAGQLGVQSIPAVFAFRDGRPADGFMGQQSRTQVDRFVQRLIGEDPARQALEDSLAEAEDMLAKGNVGEAVSLFSSVLGQDPRNARALAGFARCYLAGGDMERARQVLDSATGDTAEDAAIQSARKALELAERGSQSEGVDACRRRIEADPKDCQARHDLAIALLADGDRMAAVDTLLELFRMNRSWNDGMARTRLIELFESFGEADPATQAGRRQLASMLFA